MAKYLIVTTVGVRERLPLFWCDTRAEGTQEIRTFLTTHGETGDWGVILDGRGRMVRRYRRDHRGIVRRVAM